MNKQDAQQMIETLENEINKNEEQIGVITTRNDQLDCAIKNLKGWTNDNQTSVQLSPIPVAREFLGNHLVVSTVPKKRTISSAGKKRIAAGQERRWAKFKALGKAPLPKEPTKAAPKRKKLHWTQKPENKKRVAAWMRKMTKARG